MKKLLSVVVATIVVAVCFFGCKTDVAPPKVSFGDTPLASVKAGETKEIAISVKTKGKLKRVSFFRKADNGEEELFGTPVLKFPIKDKYESVVTLQDITVGLVFVVEAVDTKDQTTRADYVITLADSAATAEAVASAAVASPSENATSSYTGAGIELGFHKNPTVGSSFRVKKNKVALLGTANQYSNSVDFLFLYGATNGITIVAPADELAETVFNNPIYGVSLWETRNSTTLVKSSVSYDAASLADVEAEVNSASSTNVNQLQQGDVIAFKTAAGQVGLVRLAYAGSSNTATLNIEVKVLN
jgi:hypothetical protein